MTTDVNQPEPTVAGRDGTAAAVSRIIQVRGLKQAIVARETGIAPSALSRFLRGEYAGDDGSIAVKLTGWLANLRRRDKLPAGLAAAPAFVETDFTARVISALEYAQLAVDIVMIATPPGLGKTRVLEQYARTRPSAWLATMSPDTALPVPMLEEIGLALGLRQLSGGAARMRRDGVRRVKDTGGILLIDEAQHQGTKALETLRRFHDSGGVALALCGDLTLPEKLDQHVQLFSRIGKRVVVMKPDAEDVHKVAVAFGVEGKEEREFLAKIARLGGGIRTAVKTVRLAFLYADTGNGGPPKIADLMAAWADVGKGGLS